MKKMSPIFSVCLLLLFGYITGTAQSQENLGKYAPWPPLFRHSINKIPAGRVEERPAKQLFSNQLHADTTSFTLVPTSLPGVIAGNATWFDYDNDGTLDIMVSGYTDSGKYITRIYTRSGDDFQDIHADIAQLGTERAIAWGDYDNDGDLDLAITGRTDTTQGSPPAAKIYRNDHGTFVDINAPLIQVYGSNANWVDIDGDGDLDLQYCGSPDEGMTFYTLIYLNDNGEFRRLQTSLPGVWGASCAWGDYDNDGLPDLLLTGYGEWGVTGAIFHNDGPAGDSGWNFTNINAPILPVNSGAVMWADIDNDGQLDAIVTGTAPGNTESAKIYHNDHGVFTDIGANLYPVSVSALAVGDFDNDGDLDLAISGSDDWTYGTNPTVTIYRNDNGNFVDIGARIQGTWYGSLEWADYDNDGKLDLLVTGGTVGRPYVRYYGPYYPVTQVYHNNLATPNTPPTAPANLNAHVVGHDIQFSWAKSTDNQTVQKALTYNIRIGTTPSTSSVINPAANISTGFRRTAKRGNTGVLVTRTHRNLPYGTYYWSVQAIDNGYAGSEFAAVKSIVVEPPAEWQMVSVPYVHQDMSTGTLYPTAKSSSFGFDGTGYIIAPTLQNGAGYWLKFLRNETPSIMQGGSLPSTTIHLTQGWNMIGSVDHSIPAPADGILSAGPYGYHDGYSPAGSLEPGTGYWVRAKTAGDLTLGVAVALPAARDADDLRTFSSITVSDPDGKSQKLYFGKSPNPRFTAERYELPPPPPEGTFDVRFTSGRLLEAYPASSSGISEYFIALRGASSPVSVSWELAPGSGENVRLNDHTVNGTGTMSIQEPGILRLVVEHTRPMPQGYVLNQNYPNPFNPSTLISFGLPVETHVALKIYNLLGQEVVTLLDEKQPAGWHEITWETGSLPSGLYFIRMSAGSFQSTQKMILMR
jgi:hypothetical protein